MARSKDSQQVSPRRRERLQPPTDRSSENGDVRGLKPAEYAPRGFPVGEMVMMWGLVICLVVAVPYLATRVPTASRTDLIWWMAGVVYQIPPPRDLAAGDRGAEGGSYLRALTGVLPDLKELGINTVRLQEFFPTSEDGSPLDYYHTSARYGNLEDFEFFVNKLDTLGLHLVLDLPLAYTSVAHQWFWEDRQRKALDTTYLWSEKPIDDQDHDTYFTNSWRWDQLKGAFYQYRANKPNSAFFNYALGSSRQKIKHVLETWIRRGVDGFIFMEYDTLQLRNRSQEGDLNHIKTLDESTKKIQNLVNMTTCFRELFDYYQDEYEGTVFFAVDVTGVEERVWRAVYDAGVDVILSHDTVHTAAAVSQGQLNPYKLKNSVQRVLARVPEGKWKAWEMFFPTDTESRISEDHQMLLNLIHLLLPGSAYLSAPQIPMITDYEPRGGPVNHFKELITWRLTPAATWGDTQVTLTDDQVFSFARFAYGKSYARYLIITNFATTEQHRNFTLQDNKLKIPDLGVIKYLTCATSTELQFESPHEVESVIFLNGTIINPMCGLIVELTLRRFL